MHRHAKNAITHSARRRGSVAGSPGLVVAGGLGTAAACQRRTRGPVGGRCPRHVRDVRLCPLARHVFFFGRREIDGVMDPAMPGWRYTRRLGITVIDHPAALEAERRVYLAAARAIIAIALLVLSDQFAEPPRPQLRAERLAIPPGEEFEQKLFHQGSAGSKTVRL